MKSVVAVESDAALAGSAEQTIKELGIANIQPDRPASWKRACRRPAPYDVILIEGAVQTVPQAILDQLAEGGRLATVIAGTAPACWAWRSSS